MREPFYSLCAEIKNIDPERVQESPIKEVMRYMWEGKDFVDLKPLASSINIYLHIPYAQLNDPKRRAEDVSQKGRHSGGESMIKITRPDDIPYAIYLIRQLTNYPFTKEEVRDYLERETGGSMRSLALTRSTRSKTRRGTGSTQTKSYSIEDHKFLTLGSPIRPLFDLLRKEIKGLDSERVQESSKKVIIRYMWEEKDFVDLKAFASGINIYLHIPYDQLNDPKRKTKDVSNLGRNSGGETLIRITRPDDIPYATYLIRQLL